MSNLQGTVLTWLGHSAVLISTAKGTKVLIDPFLSQNPAYPKDYVLPEKIDLILLTHAHFDHVGDTLSLAKEKEATVVGIFELASWVASKGVEQTVGMNIGGAYRYKDLTISMVEAKHSSSLQDGDKILYGGQPAGYVIQIEGGPTLYHSGDTSVFGDMALIQELYQPEIGFLPIGDFYTMGPKQAALAIELLGLKTVIPIHHGTFPGLPGTPQELTELTAGSPTEIKVLRPGESWS